LYREDSRVAVIFLFMKCGVRLVDVALRDVDAQVKPGFTYLLKFFGCV
jgi:hypothetical protein